jgi:hypothetical protein
MKKIKLNALVDISAFFASLVSIFSGIVLWQVLPSGAGFRGGRGLLTDRFFLGLTRHDWIDVHNISSLIFVILVAYHLILHWNWIKNLPNYLTRKEVI